MTSIPPRAIDEAERLVRGLADKLTRPRHQECLCCYVARMLEEYGCNETQRHSLRYRDAVAPRAVALADRLRRVGAFCDCELFLNGYALRATRSAGEAAVVADGLDPSPVPPCAGARKGSTKPCRNWIGRRHGR